VKLSVGGHKQTGKIVQARKEREIDSVRAKSRAGGKKGAPPPKFRQNEGRVSGSVQWFVEAGELLVSL